MDGVRRGLVVLLAVAVLTVIAPAVASASAMASWYSWTSYITPANPVPGQTIQVRIMPFAAGDYGTLPGDVPPVRWTLGRPEFANWPAIVGVEMLTWNNGQKLLVQYGARRVATYDSNGALVVSMVVPAKATRPAGMLVGVWVSPVSLTGRGYLDPGWTFAVMGGGISPASVPITVRASTSAVRVGGVFTLSGRLAGGRIGDVVSVEVKRPGQTVWSYSSNRGVTALSGDAGLWNPYRYLAKVRGTYSFRVRFRGSDVAPACLSDVVSVAVR